MTSSTSSAPIGSSRKSPPGICPTCFLGLAPFVSASDGLKYAARNSIPSYRPAERPLFMGIIRQVLRKNKILKDKFSGPGSFKSFSINVCPRTAKTYRFIRKNLFISSGLTDIGFRSSRNSPRTVVQSCKYFPASRIHRRTYPSISQYLQRRHIQCTRRYNAAIQTKR